jgi:tRNA pseudouridine38-40 synthase
MRYRATLAYDGASFFGYQRQKDDTPTVQGTLEAALTGLANAPVTVYAAGRTDTGVHATGQVIAFDLDWSHGCDALGRALNANLPQTVRVRDVQVAPPDFHPRFGALDRTYVYTLAVVPYPNPLLRHTAWLWTQPLDVDALQDGAARLIGERDFGALGTPPVGVNTVRVVHHAGWTITQDDAATWLRFTITANAFLYRMVRRTVGVLTDIGRGKLTAGAFAAQLEQADLLTGVTIAPPQGLVLTRVRYPQEVTSAIANEC